MSRPRAVRGLQHGADLKQRVYRTPSEVLGVRNVIVVTTLHARDINVTQGVRQALCLSKERMTDAGGVMNRVALIAMLTMLHPAISLVQAQNEPAFRNAVVSYVELQRSEVAELPPARGTVAGTQDREAQLSRRIQARRPDARPGDILGLAAEHIRNLVSGEIAGAKGTALLSSIEQTNIHGVKLRVNHRYPPTLPRVTMPTPILVKLPPVPSELEYRFLGRSLVLVDTECALVVDVLPDVLPPPVRSRR